MRTLHTAPRVRAVNTPRRRDPKKSASRVFENRSAALTTPRVHGETPSPGSPPRRAQVQDFRPLTRPGCNASASCAPGAVAAATVATVASRGDGRGIGRKIFSSYEGARFPGGRVRQGSRADWRCQTVVAPPRGPSWRVADARACPPRSREPRKLDIPRRPVDRLLLRCATTPRRTRYPVPDRVARRAGNLPEHLAHDEPHSRDSSAAARRPLSPAALLRRHLTGSKAHAACAPRGRVRSRCRIPTGFREGAPIAGLPVAPERWAFARGAPPGAGKSPPDPGAAASRALASEGMAGRSAAVHFFRRRSSRRHPNSYGGPRSGRRPSILARPGPHRPLPTTCR